MVPLELAVGFDDGWQVVVIIFAGGGVAHVLGHSHEDGVVLLSILTLFPLAQKEQRRFDPRSSGHKGVLGQADHGQHPRFA